MEDEEKKVEKTDAREEKKKKKVDESLPYCTTTPSAEHARSHDDDEPCDDGRSGDVD